MMRALKKLISYNEAKQKISEKIREIESVEYVTILHATGRVIAEDTVSKMNVPPFDRASMDGYAVIAEDTFSASHTKPCRLNIIGEVFAGEKKDMYLKRGDAIKIATGAVLPKGADAVVIFEETDVEKNILHVYKPVYPGANVSRKGSDIKDGEVVISKGKILDASKIGALASLGYSEVLVYKKPIVSIIPTGNEIAEVGSILKEGQVYNANTYTIASVIIENGGVPRPYPIIEDNAELLEKNIRKAVEESDFVILTGGSSVGERDMLIDVLTNIANVHFHGVQVKPGKPIIFATVNEKPIFGLPGYPTSCLMNVYAFVLPALRKCARLKEHYPKVINAKLSQRVASTLGRHQFLTVKLSGEYAIPVFKESGAITSMSQADGYIEIPSEVEVVEKDENVEVKLF